MDTQNPSHVGSLTRAQYAAMLRKAAEELQGAATALIDTADGRCGDLPGTASRIHAVGALVEAICGAGSGAADERAAALLRAWCAEVDQLVDEGSASADDFIVRDFVAESLAVAR